MLVIINQLLVPQKYIVCLQVMQSMGWAYFTLFGFKATPTAQSQ